MASRPRRAKRTFPLVAPALYAAVAEILAVVFRQRGVLPGSLAQARHRSAS